MYILETTLKQDRSIGLYEQKMCQLSMILHIGTLKLKRQLNAHIHSFADKKQERTL